MSVERRGPNLPGPIPRENGFGALRLLFAALVIVTHTVEMLDGSPGRDPLFAAFGGMTSAGLAVDGFFLISGFLIAASYASSPGDFFLKRILRIYPAFLVCYVLSVLVVAPLAGASLASLGASDWARLAYRMVMLKSPEVDGVFEGLHIQALNGSMWTISYEFRCYILAAILGAIGLYGRPRVFLSLTAGVIAVYLALALKIVRPPHLPGVDAILGEPAETFRLLAVFMCGTAFWLVRPKLDGRAAAACAVAALACQFLTPIAELGFMIFGGYVLFWVAFQVAWRPLRTINAKDDISYGLYLYAWPVASLLLYWAGPWRPIPLGLATLVLAALAGVVSWFLIEKPALRLKRSRRRAAAADTPSRAAGPA